MGRTLVLVLVLVIVLGLGFVAPYQPYPVCTPRVCSGRRSPVEPEPEHEPEHEHEHEHEALTENWARTG